LAKRAFAWYEDAIRLFKRAPVVWCVLGFVTLAADLGLAFIPGIGVAASKVILPVVECGMLIGAAALDAGAPLTPRYALAAFLAPPAALAAIVVSGLLVFAAQALVAYGIDGVNLLAVESSSSELSATALFAVLGTGAIVSLPVAFVPFAALFGGASFAGAFAASARAFFLNVAPLMLFGLLALVLVGLGVLTFVGLIAVFPLLSAASYAAWKDIFRAAPLA
jgi:hypothetical protein